MSNKKDIIMHTNIVNVTGSNLVSIEIWKFSKNVYECKIIFKPNTVIYWDSVKNAFYLLRDKNEEGTTTVDLVDVLKSGIWYWHKLGFIEGISAELSLTYTVSNSQYWGFLFKKDSEKEVPITINHK